MIDALLDEIGALCQSGLASAGSSRAHLQTVMDAVGEPRRAAPVDPAFPEPVSRLLPECLVAARRGGTGALADAIEGCAGSLVWRQTFDAYGRDPALARFQSTYAFASAMAPSLRGPYSPRLSDRAMVGLTIQGPDTRYPPHAHKAIEVYYVIAGTAEWQQGRGPWRPCPPGTFLFHDAHEPHAMRTGSETLLTVYAWVNDLDSGYAMVAD
jgi:mannose-6-phosphate isomerase-like protein (cupin superfamily)